MKKDEAKIELLKAEKEKIVAKHKAEERVIHAWSMFAIWISVPLIILLIITLFIINQ